MKRLIVIMIVILTTLAGCSKGNKTLYIVFNYAPLTKVPNKKSEIITISTLLNFYDPLIKFDPDLRPYPSLAEYWETEDSTTWIFYLRKNVKFADGKDFTSKDVLYTFISIMNDTTSEYGADISSIDTILLKDPYTVIFKLKFPTPTFLEKISQILIIEDSCSSLLFSTYSCGTGALKFIKEDKNGTIYAEPNRGYFDKKVEFDKIILTTKDAVVLIYPKKEKNTYFLFIDEPPKNFQNLTNFIKIQGPLHTIRYIGVNTKRWPLNQISFRKALYTAVFREKLSDSVSKFFDYPVLPAYEMALFSQIGFISYKDSIRTPKDSIQKLLKTSGYNGEPISLIVSKERLHYAQLIKNNLKEAGINIEIEPLNPHEIFKRVKETRDFSLFLLALVPQSIDIHGLVQEYFHTPNYKKNQGVKNYFSYSSPLLDSLTELAFYIYNEKERKKILEKIEYILVQELPTIPLLYEGDKYYISRELKYKPRIDRLVLANEIKLNDEY